MTIDPPNVPEKPTIPPENPIPQEPDNPPIDPEKPVLNPDEEPKKK